MTLKEAKSFISWAKDQGVKRAKFYVVADGATLEEVEFYPKEKEPMALDPKSLAKTLSDSMPPDSAMLFASTEGVPDGDYTVPNENHTSE